MRVVREILLVAAIGGLAIVPDAEVQRHRWFWWSSAVIVGWAWTANRRMERNRRATRKVFEVASAQYRARTFGLN